MSAQEIDLNDDEEAALDRAWDRLDGHGAKPPPTKADYQALADAAAKSGDHASAAIYTKQAKEAAR